MAPRGIEETERSEDRRLLPQDEVVARLNAMLLSGLSSTDGGAGGEAPDLCIGQPDEGEGAELIALLLSPMEDDGAAADLLCRYLYLSRPATAAWLLLPMGADGPGIMYGADMAAAIDLLVNKWRSCSGL